MTKEEAGRRVDEQERGGVGEEGSRGETSLREEARTRRSKGFSK